MGRNVSEALFEQAELWPIQLTFLHAGGLTLWGSGRDPDAQDRVLVVDGRLILLPTEPELRAFVAQDSDSSLAALPGYALLRARASEGTVALEPDVAFDYRAVAAALDWPLEHWHRAAAGDLLAAMNMLLDIARSLGDHELVEQFDGGAYDELVDRLTFVEEHEVREAVAGLNLPALRQLLGMSIRHIERSVISGQIQTNPEN